MRIRNIHGWHLSVAEARELQEKLACQVSKKSDGVPFHLVAGVDISVKRDNTAKAAVVVLTFPGLVPVEAKTAVGDIRFPYVPGLLTFREAPLLLSAFEKLQHTPDIVLVDGQGIAHPRRLGLASHLGLLLDIPTIGCAKSRLCGTHEMPADNAGSYTGLYDGEEVIGVVLRTKKGVRPVYVSIGHRCDLETAREIVLQSCRNFRIPQPTRLAHLVAGGNTVIEFTG